MAMRDTREPGSVQTLHFKVEDIRDGAICLPGGRWRAVLAVESVVSFRLLANNEREQIFGGFRSFLNTLSFPVQIMYRSELADVSGYEQEMARAMEEMEHERLVPYARDHVDFVRLIAEEHGLLEQKYYVVVSAEEGVASAAVGFKALAGRLNRDRRARQARLDREAALAQLEMRCDAVERGLSRCGAVARRLDDAELAVLFYRCWNPDLARTQRLRANACRFADSFAVVGQASRGAPARSRAPLPEARAPERKRGLLGRWRERREGWSPDSEEARMIQQGTRSVVDLLAPASIEVQHDHIRLESRYVRTLKLAGYPRTVDAGWLNPLIEFVKPLELSMHITPINVNEAVGSLSHKLAVLQTSRTLDARDGKLHDPDREAAFGDANRLRDSLSRGDEKLFSVSLYVTIKAPSKRELEELTERVEDEFERMMASTRYTTYKQDIAFHSALPEGTDGIRAVRNLDTTSLATMIPFTSGSLSMEGGMFYGVATHNRTLVTINPFDDSLVNANMTVFAKSGGGKSYGTKLMLLRNLYRNVDCYIIDPDGEYRTLCDAVGGQYVRLSAASRQHINPFDLPVASDDATDGLTEHVNALIGWLEIMLCSSRDELSSHERSILDRALYDAYAAMGITKDPATHGKQPPVLGDLVEALRAIAGGWAGNPVADELAIRLERYTTGSLSGMFNSRTNVELENRFIVFDVSEVKDNMKALTTHTISNFVWRQVRRRLKPRLLVIDEAWTLMKHAEGGAFLAEFARKARKRYLGLVTITQDVEDFLSSEHGRTVLGMSTLKLLLRHDSSCIAATAEAFNLSTDERHALMEADKGCGLLFARDSHVPIQIVASPEEHVLITTNPKELAARQARRAQEAAIRNGHRTSLPRAEAPRQY